MEKKTKVWIGLAVIGVVFLAGLMIFNIASRPSYDLTTIIAASEESGNLPEHVEGDPNAPILIFEYGDYQCTACAPMNPYINEIIEDYDGKVAVVFRTVVFSYHQNGTAAASAAEAAAIQGYWKEYKDLLYENQADWYYSDAATRQKQFENYFEQVTEGKGDLEKFREDMGSTAVSKKLRFDATLSRGADIQWTPTFYIGEVKIDNSKVSIEEAAKLIRAEIDRQLAEQSK